MQERYQLFHQLLFVSKIKFHLILARWRTRFCEKIQHAMQRDFIWIVIRTGQQIILDPALNSMVYMVLLTWFSLSQHPETWTLNLGNSFNHPLSKHGNISAGHPSFTKKIETLNRNRAPTRGKWWYDGFLPKLYAGRTEDKRLRFNSPWPFWLVWFLSATHW